LEPKIATVSQINGYVKKILDHNIILNNVWIKGEISNFKHHYSGHLYITLKDEGGVLKAVMFRGSAQSLNFEPSDGMKVLARGRISVYEAGGSYQLYIEEMIPDGVGELYIAYEQLKKQLEEEGLFRPEHKKPIPKFPKRVGVVTASTGAAVRDIINVITRRYPMAEIVIYPAQVQGVGAAESVVKAIEYFNATNEVDTLIVGRGGGSIEDLWAFNEEMVARAIFECQTPVISAVGHETDVTIADYVADLRAPTPSAAAELAVFDYKQFEETVAAYKLLLDKAANRKLEQARFRLEQCRMRLKLKNPERRVNDRRQQLADMEECLNRLMQEALKESRRSIEKRTERLNYLMAGKLEKEKHRLALDASRLEGLSPLKKLSAGYGFVQKKSGEALRSVTQVKPGDTVCVYVTDGSLETLVKEVRPDDIRKVRTSTPFRK